MKVMSNLNKSIVLPTYISLFQVIFILLMGIFGRFKTFADFDNSEVPKLYSMFMDVHSMIFVGFGFLMIFLKRYGYSSVGFNFIIAAYVLEWSLLLKGWLRARFLGRTNGVFEIDVHSLLEADISSASILVAFGVVLGKASLFQLLLMATIQVVVQSGNKYIGYNYLKVNDVGESIYVHLFGAYFGLATSFVLSFRRNVHSEKEDSTYSLNLISMIGTIFLFLYWPSFNSATAKDEGQTRAIVNTYLSIAASVITTFITSLYVGKGRLNMIHIQNATLAGGVAVGAVADVLVQPFASTIIGSFAGIASTLGFHFLTPILNKKFIHDTCGVHNLHGIPGLISAISSIIVAASASRANFNGDRLYEFYPSRTPALNSTEYFRLNLAQTAYRAGGLGYSATTQVAYHIIVIGITLALAIVGGIVTGAIMRLPLIDKVKDDEFEMFEDEVNWKVPEDFKEIDEGFRV